MRCKIYRLLLLSFFIFLTSCTVLNEKNTSVEENIQLQISPEAKEKPSEDFVVKGWTKKSTNNNGKDFIVAGSLIKNGFTLGDVMMFASWPDPSAEGGEVHCDLLAHHGVGQCIAHTEHLTKSLYVPVKLKFEYMGNYYYGETGFTPE